MYSKAAGAAPGETILINAQLISTGTGAAVWADRFQGERNKLGELQVEFVARLANSLGIELVKAEALRAMRERPSNPDASDLAMQAENKWNFDDKASLNDAVTLSERALALDPQNVRALDRPNECFVSALVRSMGATTPLATLRAQRKRSMPP